jgi:spermidine/putrescine transport system permease protein
VGSAHDLDLGTDQARVLDPARRSSDEKARIHDNCRTAFSASGADPLPSPARELARLSVAGAGSVADGGGDPVIWRSLTIAATCTLITVVLCFPMAYFVAFHGGRHKALWLIILTLPFWTSYLLRIFAWKVVLGYEGVLNTALIGIGVVDEPVAALLYSQAAVTVVLAHAWAAFAILPIYVSLEKIDRTYLEAAADLGDSPARRFWRIIVPLSMPGVVAAFVLMFVPTVGEYITPAMVGGPDGMMIGNLIQAMFGPMNNWPAGAALSVVMVVTIGLAGLVFLALNRLMQR